MRFCREINTSRINIRQQGTNTQFNHLFFKATFVIWPWWQKTVVLKFSMPRVFVHSSPLNTTTTLILWPVFHGDVTCDFIGFCSQLSPEYNDHLDIVTCISWGCHVRSYRFLFTTHPWIQRPPWYCDLCFMGMSQVIL